MTDQEQNWYAAKILKSRPQVTKYISNAAIETFVPTIGGKPFLGSLIFLRCTEEEILRLKYDWFSQVAVYRDTKREKPEAIPEREMYNFRMVLGLQDEDIIPVAIHDSQFLLGERVRVTGGPFKGAEGVIRRIKGDRRLIVAITGIAAIATSYIRPEFLEKVPE